MITRRLFTATFLFLCYVTIASGGEPVQTLIDVGPGSGVEVRIVGKNADMIEILRDGREIFFDKILDQSMDHSDVRYIYAAAELIERSQSVALSKKVRRQKEEL